MLAINNSATHDLTLDGNMLSLMIFSFRKRDRIPEIQVFGRIIPEQVCHRFNSLAGKLTCFSRRNTNVSQRHVSHIVYSSVIPQNNLFRKSQNSSCECQDIFRCYSAVTYFLSNELRFSMSFVSIATSTASILPTILHSFFERVTAVYKRFRCCSCFQPVSNATTTALNSEPCDLWTVIAYANANSDCIVFLLTIISKHSPSTSQGYQILRYRHCKSSRHPGPGLSVQSL